MDLDQGGNNPEHVTKVNLGPSLGWVLTKVKPTQNITTGGVYILTPGSSVVLVNSTAAVTLILPDVLAWINELAYMPATGFERAIVIKDLGGHAATANIIVTPFGTQKIDTAAGSYVINKANQVLYLLPLKDFSGWFISSQIPAVGGGSTGIAIGTTPITGGTSGNNLYDNAGVVDERNAAAATAYLNTFTSTLNGLAPLSGGGAVNFLRADGTWSAPPGSGGTTIGTSTITGGVTGNFLYDNAGVYGEQTPTQVTATLNVFTSALKGLSPASGGGTTNFLRADGTWAAPGIPINNQSVAYTAVLADANTAITHPTTDNTARTFTIPANASVAYPVGTTLTFVNMINTLTIAITTDTMTLAGAGTTGSRTLAAAGIATALKITATTWLISGTGLT